MNQNPAVVIALKNKKLTQILLIQIPLNSISPVIKTGEIEFLTKNRKEHT